MKKVIRLSEQDLVGIIKNILSGSLPGLDQKQVSGDENNEKISVKGQ